jgi:delta24(24(1))-sterol reductase
MAETKQQPPQKKKEELEFGGPYGCLAVMIFSIIFPYYLWYCLEFNEAKLTLIPSISTLIEKAWPTWQGTSLYLGFILFEFALAWLVPGLIAYGAPLPHENNRKLQYNCNAIQAWYITLITAAVLHVTRIVPMTAWMDHLGPAMTVAILFSNFVAICIYTYSVVTKTTFRCTGHFFYDFFMGTLLNPRIGPVDLKMFAEARLSWILLFLLTSSAATKQYEQLGYLTSPMVFMIVAHFLYVNAIMKGEECILTSWDIFYEKWGWLLIYWNLAGVPFVYCYQSVYIMKQGANLQGPSTPVLIFMYIVLFTAYYVWDTGNGQRNTFRMVLNGTWRKRNTFPQLPWTVLQNPKYMDTEAGSKLLIDGWFAYCRKPHYTADVTMALLWGLICGFDSYIPYFYFLFFFGMIVHRNHRDIERCRRKYKQDWVRYCEKVPYAFIPYVY